MYALVAIIATAVLLVQLLFLLFGFEDEDDWSFDDDPDLEGQDIGFHLFSSRGVVAFFALFGWCGVACLENGLNGFVTIVLACIAGMLGLFGVALAFLGFTKLQEDGTKDISTAVGKTGTVYIPIPANRNGMGKVNVVVSGSLGEFDAYTDNAERLGRGQSVEVIEVTNNILVVMPHDGRKER